MELAYERGQGSGGASSSGDNESKRQKYEMLGAFNNAIKGILARHNSARFVLQEKDTEPKIMVFNNIDDASAHTKLSKKFLGKLNSSFNECGFLSSIRIQDYDASANRQYELHFKLPANEDDGVYDCKDTRTSTKSNKPGYVAAGNLVRDPDDRTPGYEYKPGDNDLAGRFPDGATDVASLEKDIIKKLCQREPNDADPTSGEIIDVKQLHGLICFSVEVCHYEKNSGLDKETKKFVRDPNAPPIIKHYIQATESLRGVLTKMNRGDYTITRIEDGCIYFSDTKSDDPERPLKKIDLKTLIPAIELEGLEQIKSNDDFAGFVLNNGLIAHSVPLTKEVTAGNFAPLMVQSGEEYGLQITSDADMEHVGKLPNLPDIAYKAFYCKNTDPQDIIKSLKQLQGTLEPISGDQYIDSLKLVDYPQEKIVGLKKLYETFKENVGSMIQKYDDPNSSHLLQRMGGSNVHDLVVQHMLDDKHVLHGFESGHPMSQPEDWKGVLSLWKGKFIVTGDEKAYLDFLFHDKDILLVQEIDVHPYWLQSPCEAINAYGLPAKPGPDLSEHWLNIIAIQALNKYHRHGQGAAVAYLERMGGGVGDVGRVNNKQAQDKIKGLIDVIKNVQSQQDAAAMAEGIYSKYKEGAEASFGRLEQQEYHGLKKP